MHYGSYESRDGTWIPATDCPVDGKTGRLLGFIPLTGHGIHPVPDQLETAFPATPSISPDSRVWGSKECLIVGYPDNPLMSSKVSCSTPLHQQRAPPIISSSRDSHPNSSGCTNPKTTRRNASSAEGHNLGKLFLLWESMLLNCALMASRVCIHYRCSPKQADPASGLHRAEQTAALIAAGFTGQAEGDERP